jgi:hypothetical protein
MATPLVMGRRFGALEPAYERAAKHGCAAAQMASPAAAATA